MNHNPHNLREGDIVRLDKGKANNSLVQIVRLTIPSNVFATVRAYRRESHEWLEWDVMTTRLTPKEE